ncbi:hypothetical protein KR038_001708, partial [Drosophila bunnanda]
LQFTVLAQSDARQDATEDFLASYADGDFIALIGSKSSVVTLEITDKTSFSAPFPYILADFEFSSVGQRPLDVLANQVNLEAIYESCNVLEAQALTLEPVYTAVCSAAVPPAKLRAVKKANGLLPNGNLLLAWLNTRGAMIFMSKPAEYPGWSQLESLNVAVVLRDSLLPPLKFSKINSFKKYQDLMDRAWITMFAWLSSQDDEHSLVLGTANGSLWLLNLSHDMQILREHKVLETSLDRICFLNVFEDFLLVGDVKGIIQLYRVSNSNESCLVLIKELWSKPDRMGLQRGVITRCPKRGCYYITCCKAAHLLTWCLQMSEEDEEWLETRLYVGGMKITGLTALNHNSYVVGNISRHLQRIQISHESNQLSLTKQSIPMDMLENFEVLDLINSSNGNLLTVFLTRNKEYMNSHLWQRNQIVMQVGEIQDKDAEEALGRLASQLKFNEPINPYTDYLAELRMKIFSQKELQRYIDFSPLDSFQFDDDATESQLLKLKIKYHVLQAISHLHSNLLELTEHARKFLDEMELLQAMLATTHIRLRLQFLRTLSKLTPFQDEAVKSMFNEAHRLINKLKSGFDEKHLLKTTTNAFVEHISTHLEILHLKLGGNPPKVMDQDSGMPEIGCCVSYAEISPSLERRYCTLCDRQILMELENLQELYEHKDKQKIICPFCHGSFTEELLNA